NPIPDGALLYTCNVRLAATAPAGTFSVGIDNVGVATPSGGALPTIGRDGRIDVVAGTAARAVSVGPEIQNPKLCAGGPDDGMPCLGPFCALGVCINPQGVCDGGDDDGLLCDCPGGRCMATGDNGTCVGGSSDGSACDTDSNCGGN